MENKKLIKESEISLALNEAFEEAIKVEIQRERRIKVKVQPDQVHPVVSFLKTKGFNHLVAISCVDWLKDNEFELVYHLWSYQDKVHVMVKTRIPRDNPVMPTLRDIFEHAQTYERDIHEFFGVDFPGNPRLKEDFILEDWPGPPPLRKDFNTRKFVEFYNTFDMEDEIFERKPQPFRGD